jgi:hypothetical protein
MSECAACGHVNQEGAQFCTKCGNALPVAKRRISIGELRAGVLVAGMVLVAGLVVASVVVLVSRSADDDRGASAPPVALTPTVSASSMPPADVSLDEGVRRLASLVQRSQTGRALSGRDPSAANENRRKILASLDEFDPPDELAAAAKLLRQAMNASIAANRVRIDCGCATTSQHDRAATAYKRRFAREFKPIAAEHGAPTFEADQF